MEGTAIKDLKGKTTYYNDIRNLQDVNLANYNVGQNIQKEQAHDASQMVYQAQHMPYYTIDENGDLKFIKPGVPRNATDAEELARDLNENLPDTFASVSEVTDEKANTNRFNIMSRIPSTFRDPLIILVIFILLSLPIVRETIGTYIPQINPDGEGKIGFTGILIYGIVLVALFMLVKRFVY